jgi:Kip1 ubiquitination-promoting complex protein 1
VQRKVYLVEAVLMGFLLGIVEKGTPVQAQSLVHQVLDLLWLFMEVRFLTRLRPGC